MLQDRPYMRDAYERRGTSVLTWIISAMIAVFIIQMIGRVSFLSLNMDGAFGFSWEGLREGHVWTLLTYGFVHSTDNLLQVVGYVLVIYFIGRELLPMLGSRRFLTFYGAALVVGAACWAAVHWRQPVVLVGASAAVSALVILYACFYPNREMTLLLFFVLPVNVKPKYVAYAMLGIDLFGLVFYELLNNPSPLGAAHSAHLGGMLAGWVYYRYVHDSDWSFGSARADVELPRWMKRKASAKAVQQPAAYSVNMSGRGNLRAEVDRILDKINSDGFGSLSADEKRILDEARDLIGKR